MLSLFCWKAPRTRSHERVWEPRLPLSSVGNPDSVCLPYGGPGSPTSPPAAAAAAPPKAVAPVRRGATAYSYWDPFGTLDAEPEAGGAPKLASKPASAASSESEVEPVERKSTTHLPGSAAFRQPPDCELEVDGIVFPVHSAIVCNASNLLDCLLASFMPTDEEEGEGAPGPEGKSAADEPAAALPRLVLKRAGPAAEGEPELPLTAGKLEAFLRHVYGVSTVQDGPSHFMAAQLDGVDDLLEMVDYLQAPHVKTVCDRELEASARAACLGGWVPRGTMELAARHKLPRTMAACMAATVMLMSKGGRGHTQSLFSYSSNSFVEEAMASSAFERASPYLDQISQDLKFHLLRATVQAAYASQFHYHAADMTKVVEGVAEALKLVPGWGDQPAAEAVPHPTSYRLLVAGPGEGRPEPPKTISDQTFYLQGKSDLFISRADLEIEVDGVRFPVHSAIVARISSHLDALLAEHQPAKPGRRLRILLHQDMPAAPSGTPAALADGGAAGAVPAAAEGQAGAHLAVPAAAAIPADADPAAPAAAPPPPQRRATFFITPENLLCFLCHCYCPDRPIAPDAPQLLKVADCFGVAKLREAAAQAVSEKFERASKNQSQLDIWPWLQYAERFKLRRMMGLCAELLVQGLVKATNLETAEALIAQFQPMGGCLDAVLWVVARMAKDTHKLGGAATQQLLEDCTATVCRLWQEQAQ